MPATLADAHPRRFRMPLALGLLAVGSLGIAAAWVLLAYARDAHCGWMAIMAAIDAAILLRLSRMHAGWWRAASGVLATLAAIALANWGIAATQLGKAVGLLPWESLWRLGAGHGWMLIGQANTQAQLAWSLLALLVAAAAAR